MSFFRLTPGVASSVFFWSLWHLAQTISENIGGFWGVDCRMEEDDVCCRKYVRSTDTSEKNGDGRSIFRILCRMHSRG